MTDERITSFTRAGLRFDVSDTGPLKGELVLLLHGFPGSRRTWGEVSSLLNAAGLRTISFDQRGYSSAARPKRRRDYRAREATDDVISLLDQMGAHQIHLVGHDWGGFVAWRLAAAAPDRFTGMTILSTPHPRALLRSTFSSAQALRSSYIAFFQLPVVPEMVLRRTLDGLLAATGLPRPFAADYASFMRARGALRAALHWYRGMWLPDGRASRAARGSARVPIVYLWGRRDQALGRRAAHFTGRYVDAPYRFVVLDENHWLPERVPERISEEIVASVRRETAPSE
ncbi:alpha/beta fold hydrolase [Microbacterium yannicii]|uniref:alpha/beta fold hydrolase n=1 Tax=Microbacterium yannicii TaxID=671622 RepID=UPI0002F8265A|nr:alpha/beta fold hydrolase [Microbacterium yannicii]